MMFKEYRQGDAVMRFKSDITHKNPAMRDFPLMRINESEHPRQGMKYRVWPLMNFSVSVDDMETGVTHTLRAKDHADNALRQEMIHKVLGFDTPEAISVGRINFDGFDLSTTQTKLKIKEGAYNGWDDIRLPFLMALKRRGYKAQALRKFAVSMGVTKTDKTVAIAEFFKTINSFNKEILEHAAERYFFVKDPVKIHVANAPSFAVNMPLHPDHPKRGHRTLDTGTDFYIAKKDYEKIPDDKIFRLMDCINVVKKGDKFHFDSLDYETYKEKGCCMILHWLPVDEEQIVKAEVLLADNERREGFAEKAITNLKVGDVLQFERFGFVRFDRKEDDRFVFWYTHN
jgi:glutamyl-tRNA synthetase